MRDRKFLRGFLTGIIVMAVVMGSIWMILDRVSFGSGAGDEVTSASHLEKLDYLETLIDDVYLGEYTTDSLVEGMYGGMVDGLDDIYSCYYTAEEYTEMSEETEGRYKGIGVVMQQDEDGTVTLIRIYEGGPGEKAGLLAGDILYTVDDEEVTGMDLSEVAALVRNEETDTAQLTVVRDGEFLDFDIPKEEVEVPVVSYEMLDDGIGYLAIYEFTSVAFDQYLEAYQDLKSQDLDGLIVDLRDNPGGLLDSVCDILETFLPEGIIVYTEDKNGNREDRTCDGESPIDIPLAVLVNGNTASASEIYAGAVQDYGVGTIVGTTTYGKGVVQSIRSLDDGSAVKLTVANYYTPLGNNINHKGITPDVEVEQPEDSEEDVQLEEATDLIREELS